jgi:hypothetical protein
MVEGFYKNKKKRKEKRNKNRKSLRAVSCLKGCWFAHLDQIGLIGDLLIPQAVQDEAGGVNGIHPENLIIIIIKKKRKKEKKKKSYSCKTGSFCFFFGSYMINGKENVIEDVLHKLRDNLALFVCVEREHWVVKEPVQKRNHSAIEEDDTANKDETVENKALCCPCPDLLRARKKKGREERKRREGPSIIDLASRLIDQKMKRGKRRLQS